MLVDVQRAVILPKTNKQKNPLSFVGVIVEYVHYEFLMRAQSRGYNLNGSC